MQERDMDRDLYLSGGERARTCLSPRVIIATENCNFLLVQYLDTSWWGLPGGKVRESEAENGNFLSAGSFPTLAREVGEECGIDISDHLDKSACLGVIEIATVDGASRQITLALTPIFVCQVPALENLRNGVQVANFRLHLPGPLFPDARAGIARLREVIKQGGAIMPVWFNQKAIYYFSLKSPMGLLMGPPSWAYK